MANKEEILRFVKEKGPVIPNQVKKELGGETYVISAFLSELSIDGNIKISNTKIGESPTYYAIGQDYKLQELKKYLNEKDQRTFDLLRQKRVLRDKNQEMLIRVSLRNIKDFAKPIQVSIKDEKEVFWRWYLTSPEEAGEIIKSQFAKPVEPENIEPKQETQKIFEPEKQKINEDIKPKNIVKEKEVSKEGFLKQVHDYFNEKQIGVVEENIIRKNSEVEFQIIIPSSVGKMEYFCKAKNKKKCNDGDLSSAYIRGQSLKLPVLFITTGEVTKKAQEMLGKEFKGMVVKQI
ncbi:MAG: hypothetical protein KKF89_02005 [Nanoarchaeota archaeon]|nr:hypothetical protein [Nanoarchaeota archaeon]MBU1854468.1 hypothetical protein [Nanoarchaeota archaeon]